MQTSMFLIPGLLLFAGLNPAYAEVTQNFPEVVPVFSEVSDHGESLFGPGRCTGTFITPRLLLTAAHCVRNFRAEIIGGVVSRPTDMQNRPVPDQTVAPAQVFIMKKGGFWGPEQIHPVRVYASPDAMPVFRTDLEMVGVQEDLAILEFAKPWPNVGKLAQQPAWVGERVFSVGFGRHAAQGSLDGMPVKHLGRNAVDEIDPEAVITKGAAASCTDPDRHSNDWATCLGDSGGPLYDAATGGIVGVASALAVPDQQDPRYVNDPRNYSIFIDVTSPRAQQFIQGVVRATAGH